MSSSNGSSNYYLRPLITYVKLNKVLTPNSSDSSIVLPLQQKAFKLEISAVDAANQPLHIFVHQVEQLSPLDPTNQAAMFSNVVSPNDWQELPESIPTDPNVILFRYSKVTVITRTAFEADYIWTSIQSDVENLIKLHKLLLSPPIGTTQTDSIVLS